MVNKTILELNENQNTTLTNLWYTMKAVIRVKYIALSVYVKKCELFSMNHLTTHLKA